MNHSARLSGFKDKMHAPKALKFFFCPISLSKTLHKQRNQADELVFGRKQLKVVKLKCYQTHQQTSKSNFHINNLLVLNVSCDWCQRRKRRVCCLNWLSLVAILEIRLHAATFFFFPHLYAMSLWGGWREGWALLPGNQEESAAAHTHRTSFQILNMNKTWIKLAKVLGFCFDFFVFNPEAF